MSPRLIVRPEAEADILGAAVWYDAQVAGLGLEFTSEISLAIHRIATNTTLYPLLHRNPDVRRVLLYRFPYRVFFIMKENAIVVFAVLHASRQDRRWRGRV